MTQKIQILTLPVKAAAAITGETFVDALGNPAAAAGNCLGAAESDAKVGEVFPVIALGTAILKAGNAILAGDGVEIGAGGVANKLGTSTTPVGKKVGIALKAATVAGDRIEVFLIPN